MTSPLTEIEEALKELIEFYDHYGHSPSNMFTYKQALAHIQKLQEDTGAFKQNEHKRCQVFDAFVGGDDE